MKKVILLVAMSLIMVFSLGAPIFASPAGAPDGVKRIFKMNIIGVPKGKTTDMIGDNGSRIFVNLTKATPIWLVEGDTFDILDANGTDSNGATFQMPAPGYDAYNLSDPPEGGVWSDYSIYIRSLGKPDGWASITTCADLIESELVDSGLLSKKFIQTLNRAGLFGGIASVEQVGQAITERPKGKSEFTNVTAELTSIVLKVEVDLDGNLDTTEDVLIEYIRVPIFDDMLENEYWEYDNHGLKLLQVWIYDNRTDVSEGDGEILGQ